MAAPVIQFKRGLFANLPGLRAGEPGFTTDKYDLYVGIDSTTSNNKFFGSHRYWTKETTTAGSAVRVVEGTDNGTNYIELKAPASIANNLTYTLPGTATNNGFLKTDGSGNLSWDATLDSTSLTLADESSDTTCFPVFATGATGSQEPKTGSNLTFNSSSGALTATSFVGPISGGTVAATSAAVADLTSGRVVLAGTSGELEDSGNLTFNGSTLGVTGAVTVSTTLGVTGESTLASATVSDLTANRIVIAGTAGALGDNSNLTFSGGTLGVTGAVTASGTVTGGNFAGSGSGLTAGTTPITTLDIDGGTATTTLANADLFVVDDGANGTNRKVTYQTLSESILGGSSGATFAAINVTGVGTVTYAKATNLSVSGITTTTGIIDANGGANISGGAGLVASTAKISDLTDNRVVIAGTSGELEDSGNLTFDGSSLGVTGTVVASSTVTASAFHTGASGSAIRVTSNTISGPATMTLDPAGVGDNTGKVVVAGDLQVDGTTTTINSTTVNIDDKNVQLATGAADDSAANGAGITVDSGDGDKTINFEATGDNWGFSENVNLASGKVLKVNNSEILSATALSTNVVVDVASVNIDGATDIGAAIADADLFLVDDGAGGTNRKTTASRMKDYFLGGGAGANFNAINVSGITTGTFLKATTATVGAGLTVTGALDVDGGGNIAGQLTLANPPRNAAGGVIPQVGVITATSDAGLVTAFKFRGNGLQDFIVADGIADVVLSGVAATTFTTSQTTTATEGQTAVTVSASYDNGFIDVYLNGIRLITGTDYTQTNSTTVTLASGATAGDEIETVAWKSLGDIVKINSVDIVDNLSVTGVTTATGGVIGNVTGNLTGTADVATSVTVSANNATNETVYPLFVDGATGTQGAETDTGFTYNPSTGALTSSSFVGSLTGAITGSGAGLSGGTVPLTALDIDGGTATTTLADADLFIVDDGAGGTNRKVTFEKLSESILGGSGGATFAAVNVTGIGTFGGIIDGNGGANISGGAGLVASSAKVSDLTSGRVVLAGTSGEIEDSGNLTFNGSQLTVTGTANVTSNLTVGGNLTVNGTTSQINTVNTTIEDTLLELQKVDGGALSSDTNKDVGLVMNYYDGSAKKAAVFWDDSAGRFVFGSVVTETNGVMGSITYGGIEVGSLYLNDCAGASQVISCSGTTRSLENITIDGGTFS